MRAGRFDLERVVDIKRIPAFNDLIYDSQIGLTLGARRLLLSHLRAPAGAQTPYPALVDAVASIGGIAHPGAGDRGRQSLQRGFVRQLRASR